MIIGNALSTALDGFTIDVNGQTISVKNTFDDQYALEKFIQAYDKQRLEKFPLIFCVTSKVTGETVLQSKRTIVIMAKTDPNWLSKDRTANTFTKVIHPIFKKLIPIIENTKGFKIIGEKENRIDFTDKSNYGVTDGSIGKKTSKQSVVTDYIDARIIELTLTYEESPCTVEHIIKR